MLKLAIGFALAATASLLTPPASHAQRTTSTQDSVSYKLTQLQRQIDSLKSATERNTDRLISIDERTATSPAGKPGQPDSIRRSIASARGIAGKPFVRRFGSGTSIGGYVDLEFSNNFTTQSRSFDQRRLVPFIYSEITDRLHFGTEIEFEHGVKIENADGEAEGAGEIAVEFATMDYRFLEGLNLRAGVILSPLGRFNLMHDSPINELTERPLVSRQVIPSTLSEAGAGLFGTLYPTGTSLLSYEIYAVNGFNSEVGAPGSNGRLPIRDAAGKRGDIDGRAPIDIVGRLAFSPLLGLEVGASAHGGPYGDDLNEQKSRNATIWALDGTFNRGAIDLLSEFARLNVNLDPAVQGPTVGDGREGFYFQGNYHFGQGWLAPKSSSSFTGVLRYDWVDYNRGVQGDDERRGTVGLNWRPVPDAVFKTEFQFAQTKPLLQSSYGNDARKLTLSLATYF